MIVLLAAHLLAPRLAQIAPFFRSCPMHDPEDTPWTHAAQSMKAGELHFFEVA
jgi:hypothetical protein